MADTVYIVRDVEERYIKGVYRHLEDAQESIIDRVREVMDTYRGEIGPEGYSSDPTHEDWEWVREDYEIFAIDVE